MANMMFVGDGHGNLNFYKNIVNICKKNDLSEFYQVGDFGYWEHITTGISFLNNMNKYLKKADIKCLWIDGNHENHSMLYEKYKADNPGEHLIRSNIIHIGRGTVKEIGGKRFLFCGGANSIDKKWRTPYVTWWPQEEITKYQFDRVIENGKNIDVLVMHEAPAGIKVLDEYLGGDENTIIYPESHRHRLLVKGIVNAVKPKLFIHGHYHYRYDDVYEFGGGEAQVIGLGWDQDISIKDSYVIIDIDNI